MQKALADGCDALRSLVEKKLRQNLVRLLFHVSELRGRAAWEPHKYLSKLGVAVDTVDTLIELSQDLLVEAEHFTRAIHETQQDFTLLFEWLLERIRIHTSSGSTLDGSPASTGADKTGSAASNSLLNQRRLCDFFQRASKVAQEFKSRQPSHSMFKVETTFGNAISQRFLSSASSAANTPQAPGLLGLITRLEEAWLAMVKNVASAVAIGVARDGSGCFSVGDSIDGLHLEFIQHGDEKIGGGPHDDAVNFNDGSDEDGDEDDDDEDFIDWSSLKSLAKRQSPRTASVQAGFRTAFNRLVLLRGSRVPTSPQTQWEVAVVEFSSKQQVSIALHSFGLYSNASSSSTPQLAVVLSRPITGSAESTDTGNALPDLCR